MLAREILVIVLGYLLGSIPFAYIVGRAVKGIDIRRSGNVGTLSVMREVGTAPGLAVLALDMGKGLAPVAVAQWLNVPQFVVFAAGFAAVVGHCWPMFLGFTGGGGIVTTLGVLLGLAPRELGISFGIIVVSVLLTSNGRFSAAVGFVFLPLLIWLFKGDLGLILYSVFLPLFLVLKNVPTFRRELTSNQWKQGFIIDRDFTPWQTKRRKKDQ